VNGFRRRFAAGPEGIGTVVLDGADRSKKSLEAKAS